MKILEEYLNYLNEFHMLPITILTSEQKKKYKDERKSCEKIPTFMKRLRCRVRVDQKYSKYGGLVL